MAGGMSKRGGSGYGTMAQRIAATRGEAPPAAVELTPLERLKHCWVTDEHGRRPALLLEWRTGDEAAHWQGRVVLPVLVDGAWEPHEIWLPAEQLDQV